jgi:hypothetical protein
LLLPHDYLLLALDDGRGTSLVADTTVHSYAMSGAWLAEMMFQERVLPAAANLLQLRSGPLSEGSLGVVEKQLEGFKAGKQLWCLNRLIGFNGTWLCRLAADDLVAMGVLRAEQDKLWLIPYRTRHPSSDMSAERALRQRLRAHLQTVDHSTAPTRDDALIGLLRVAKILTSVWTEEELRHLRPLIVERTKRSSLGKVVKKAADAAKVAIAASV